MKEKNRKNRLLQRKLMWISYLNLDRDLHKTSRIQILENLAYRGYTVYLFATWSREKYELKKSSINLISIPFRYVSIFSSFLFTIYLFSLLPYYIVALRPDIIVTEPGMTIFSLAYLSRLNKIRISKLVLDIRSTPVETRGLKGYITSLLFNLSVIFARNFFDGMTVITPLMKHKISNRFNIDPEFIGVWTSGVSPSFFDPRKNVNEGLKIRKKFGLNDKFVIFYHGNFGTKRGIVECVKSMSLLKDIDDIVLFLLGNGDSSPNIKEIIDNKDIRKKVIIHEPVDYAEVPKYIAMCDVGILPLPDLPDWRYQCPLKLLEYLSMEKPVILTDIPAHRAVIGKNKCGIYLTSADPGSIAIAIAGAYNNRQELKKLGRGGREIVIQRYTWSKVAESFDLYLSGLSIKEGK